MLIKRLCVSIYNKKNKKFRYLKVKNHFFDKNLNAAFFAVVRDFIVCNFDGSYRLFLIKRPDIVIYCNSVKALTDFNLEARIFFY